MANTFANNQVILDDFLAHFENNVQFLLTANRNFTENYKDKPMRKGDTLQYRLPYGFTVGHSLTVTPQDVSDRTRPLTVGSISNIALQFNGKEITLEDVMKDPFAKEYMLSQIEAIANDVELTVATNFYKQTYHSSGTPGAALSSSGVGDIRKKAGKLGILSTGKWYGALNYDASNDLTNSQNTIFNQKVNSAALEKGYLGELKGFEFFETAHLPRHTSGAGAGGSATAGKKAAGTTNGAVSSGKTLLIKGLAATATVFTDGDIIEVTGVNSVNPLTKDSTKMVQQFVVVGDVTSDGTGNATVTVSPDIVTSGPYQNVDGAIPDNTAVTLYDDHDVSLFYSKEALYYAAPQLAPLKNGVTSGFSYDPRYRMYFTYNRGSDVINYLEIERLDHLHGEAYNPEFAIRAMS